MRAFFVVVLALILHLFPSISKAQEPVYLQLFNSEATVERFDKRIVRGLSWPREECDATLGGHTSRSRDTKLGGLVDADACWRPHLSADSFQHLDDIRAA
jgi:hypothetical protein